MIPTSAKLKYVIVLTSIAILFSSSILLEGCGGGRLTPRDVKDYMAAAFKVDRKKFEVTVPFRTTMIRRINAMPIRAAREAQREFIEKFFDYCREGNVKDYQNDTLLFLLRLDVNPDINLKYFGLAYDAREVVDGVMDVDTFIDRCTKEENWAEELG